MATVRDEPIDNLSIGVGISWEVQRLDSRVGGTGITTVNQKAIFVRNEHNGEVLPISHLVVDRFLARDSPTTPVPTKAISPVGKPIDLNDSV